MPSVFSVFFAEKPDGPSRLPEYMQYMRAGASALKKTNPDWDYVVLTDEATAPKLEHEFRIAVTAPDDVPLMLKYMMAQKEFLETNEGGIAILAAADCVPNKDLRDAMRPMDGLAVTY